MQFCFMNNTEEKKLMQKFKKLYLDFPEGRLIKKKPPFTHRWRKYAAMVLCLAYLCPCKDGLNLKFGFLMLQNIIWHKYATPKPTLHTCANVGMSLQDIDFHQQNFMKMGKMNLRYLLIIWINYDCVKCRVRTPARRVGCKTFSTNTQQRRWVGLCR